MTPQQLVYKSKSWKDFENKLSKLQPKERGTAFEFCKEEPGWAIAFFFCGFVIGETYFIL